MTKNSIGLFFVLSLILAICSCAPVTIDTTPTGATVYSADGQTQLGNTPFNTSVFVGDKNFAIRKDRYIDDTVKLNFESPRKVDLTLRPMPVLVYSKPDADIYLDDSTNLIGRTPMKLQVSVKNKTYTLKAADYYDQNITIGLETTDPLVVKLARRPIVTVSAVPTEVEFYENGQLIGTSSVREEILTSRTFELRKPGYFTKRITLESAPPYEMAIELKPFPIVTVTTVPGGAQIYRADKVIGKAPVKFAVGEKTTLEVRADRYYPQSITLTPESPAQVDIALKAMPYVTVISSPAGAEVFVGDKSIGVTPVEQLIEKNTVVELRKEGFVTKTATLTGADKQVTVTLEAVPAAPAPAIQPVETKELKTAVADSKNQVAAPEQKKTGGQLRWIVGGAIIAVAGLVFFLIKRKKQ